MRPPQTYELCSVKYILRINSTEYRNCTQTLLREASSIGRLYSAKYKQKQLPFEHIHYKEADLSLYRPRRLTFEVKV